MIEVRVNFCCRQRMQNRSEKSEGFPQAHCVSDNASVGSNVVLILAMFLLLERLSCGYLGISIPLGSCQMKFVL